MSYIYDTHVHTSETSACAKSSGKEQARNYKERGYAGIIVTDHFFNGNTTVPRKGCWQERVDLFCRGYEEAKKEGERIGLQVFFGWEASYTGCDFLVYGLGKEWILAHPEIEFATIKEQYKMVKASGGFLIHAHPFREACYIPKIRLYPNYVDGVEVVNGGNERINPKFDKRAYKYALEKKLPMTEGSDCHRTEEAVYGMVFSAPLCSALDYGERVVRQGEGELLSQWEQIKVYK